VSARAAKRAARGLDSRQSAFDTLKGDKGHLTRPGSLNRKRSSKMRPGKNR
jgi:hypothetical protein